MAQPPETPQTEESEYAGDASTGQNVTVGDAVLPPDPQDASEAAHMESVQATFLALVADREHRLGKHAS